MLLEDFLKLPTSQQVDAYRQIKSVMEEKEKDAEQYLKSLQEVNK